MSRPQAYEPCEGQRFQILCRNQRYSRAWEHCDYAIDRQERNYLVGEYRMAYGAGWEFQSILLPRKYWPVAPVFTNALEAIQHAADNGDKVALAALADMREEGAIA